MTSRKDMQATNLAKGFTLLEILVVIAILGVLMLIIVPSIQSARRSALLLQTEARIQSLEDGIDGFYSFSGRYYYPGQTPRGQNVLGNALTGSRLLAQALWTPREEDYIAADAGDLPGGYPTGAYTGHSDNYEMSYQGVDHLLSDDFSGDLMPILYYPACPGTQGKDADAQYKYKHNQAISTPGGEEADFYEFISEDGDRPYNPGKYLLIAPGADREYFTADDITNFTK